MFVKLRLVEVLLGENNTLFHKIQNLDRYQFIDIVHVDGAMNVLYNNGCVRFEFNDKSLYYI